MQVVDFWMVVHHDLQEKEGPTRRQNRCGTSGKIQKNSRQNLANSQLLDPTKMRLLKLKGNISSVSSADGGLNSYNSTELISIDYKKSAFPLTNSSTFVPVTAEASIKLQHLFTATTNISSLSYQFDGMVIASPGLTDKTLKTTANVNSIGPFHGNTQA